MLDDDSVNTTESVCSNQEHTRKKNRVTIQEHTRKRKRVTIQEHTRKRKRMTDSLILINNACPAVINPICYRLAEVVSNVRYDYYSFTVIPALGELIVGDRESYQYLVESVRRFPTQDKFAPMISEAGFEKVEYENLVGGVLAIHSGLKL